MNTRNLILRIRRIAERERKVAGENGYTLCETLATRARKKCRQVPSKGLSILLSFHVFRRSSSHRDVTFQLREGESWRRKKIKSVGILGIALASLLAKYKQARNVQRAWKSIVIGDKERETTKFLASVWFRSIGVSPFVLIISIPIGSRLHSTVVECTLSPTKHLENIAD